MLLENKNKMNGTELPDIIVSEFFAEDKNNWPGLWNRNSIPGINISEDTEEYQFTLVAPGCSRDDFSLSIDHKILFIAIKYKRGSNAQAQHYLRQEFHDYSFHRAFKLPGNASEAIINIDYANGILNFEIPKLKTPV